MVFEDIEQLQREYTNQYVVVDEDRPELRRFKGMVGFVKTVNMSGRALVQFDANNNLAWYDIDIDFLKVVDKPPPKAETKPVRRAAAPKAADKPTPPPAGDQPAS
jgi:hypothetical protein